MFKTGEAKKLSIVYPGKVLCPNCKNYINLNYSDSIAQTSDMLSIQIKMPQTSHSGSDANKNNQKLGLEAHYLLICKHCTVILGTVPGSMFLMKYSS